MHYQTLTEALDALYQEPRHVTYLEAGGRETTLSFAQLRQRALGILGYFQQRGLAPGDELILVLQSNEAFLDAFWACLYGGIIPVPVAPGGSEEQREKLPRVYRRLRRPHVYSSHALWGRLDTWLQQRHPELRPAIKRNTILTEDIEDVSPPGTRLRRMTPPSSSFLPGPRANPKASY